MNGAIATGCPADKKEVIITAEQDHVTKITEDNPDAFWDLIPLKKEIVYKDGIQFPREMKDLPNFLPRLCEKYSGADGSQIHPYVWNLEMSDVNALLIEGKTFDKQQRAKKTKSHKKGGNPR